MQNLNHQVTFSTSCPFPGHKSHHLSPTGAPASPNSPLLPISISSTGRIASDPPEKSLFFSCLRCSSPPGAVPGLNSGDPCRGHGSVGAPGTGGLRPAGRPHSPHPGGSHQLPGGDDRAQGVDPERRRCRRH